MSKRSRTKKSSMTARMAYLIMEDWHNKADGYRQFPRMYFTTKISKDKRIVEVSVTIHTEDGYKS